MKEVNCTTCGEQILRTNRFKRMTCFDCKRIAKRAYRLAKKLSTGVPIAEVLAEVDKLDKTQNS